MRGLLGGWPEGADYSYGGMGPLGGRGHDGTKVRERAGNSSGGKLRMCAVGRCLKLGFVGGRWFLGVIDKRWRFKARPLRL
jgi:hypothetical protein